MTAPAATTRSEPETGTSHRLYTLKDLTDGYVDEVVEAVLRGAATTHRGRVDGADLAALVMAWDEGWSLNGCEPGVCPADLTGEHAYQAVRGLVVSHVDGGRAKRLVVDGLSPYGIVAIKAHTVAVRQRGLWDLLAHKFDMADGDSKSFGAIILHIRPKSGRALSLIVAVSGAKPGYDEAVAVTIAYALKARLLDEGFIESVVLENVTFVIGADPDEVAAFAAEQAAAAGVQQRLFGDPAGAITGDGPMDADDGYDPGLGATRRN